MGVFDQLDNLLVESPTLPDDLNIFSVWSPEDNNSERNPGFWAASLNFTGFSFWPFGGDTPPIPDAGGVTVVSRRHVIGAWHTHTTFSPGIELVWIAADGTRVMRTVLGRSEVRDSNNGYIDIGVAYIGLPGFDGDVEATDPNLPETITSYKVLPKDWFNHTSYIPSEETLNPAEGVIATRPPVIALHQTRQASVREISYIRHLDTLYNQVVHHLNGSPPWPWIYEMYDKRQNYGQNTVPGDSGKSLFLLLGGELVFMATFFNGVTDHHIGGYVPEINAKMLELEAAEGETDGYQLTEFDLTTATSVCSRSNHIIFGTQSSPYRMKLSIATPRKSRGDGIIFLTKTRPVINTVIENFTVETQTYNLGVGEFSYVSVDQLLRLENYGPLTDAMVADPSASGAPYGVVVSPLDVADRLLSTIHQDRIPIV